MEENRFLKSLDHPIPQKANDYMLSSYSIILEAWRRGLKISFRIVKEGTGNFETDYVISDGNRKHHFSATRGDLVSKQTKDLTKNKLVTKEILQKKKVSTPGGRDFDADVSDSDIIKYASEIDYPLVVKPLAGTGGRGVIAGIRNEEELIEALNYVRVKLKFPHIILEKYFTGEDYRLYVLDGKVIGALKRVKANVIGDGKSTVRQLINQKNIERAKLPSLTNRKIKIDDELKNMLRREGYDLKSVIPNGELVYIKSKNNVSAGGDSIDVTDKLSDNIKQIAVDAVNAFDDLPQCGVDLMINEESDTGVVIELNTRAHITQHLFPMKGQARDIPSDLIDFYFPETINYNREGAQKFFLDFNFIFDACMNGNATDIKLPVLPTEALTLTRYVISGCDYTEAFADRVQRLAAYNARVNGYIKPLNNGDISIIVGSSQKRINDFHTRLEKYVKRVSKSATITEKKRSSPIMHGFHIESTNEETVDNNKGNSKEKSVLDKYMKDYAKLKSDYQNAVNRLAKYERDERTLELTQRQNKQLKKRLQQMEESNSWKMTKPIRAFTEKLKK
ncbi:ATP-grasp domain-containing protein [Oceanobacillus timonensis]|uniref:ATP-grasp domain-containing protein n=1 Tax=Oceanobacillus timonensis TaxID=1926285 RepID=UPI0009BA0050|nr:ATP-grasp domain-containing protein [Oceanobacillus timonensis]